MHERPSATVFLCRDGMTWIATLTIHGEHHSVHRIGMEEAQRAVEARGRQMGWDVDALAWADITRYGEAADE